MNQTLCLSDPFPTKVFLKRSTVKHLNTTNIGSHVKYEDCSYMAVYDTIDHKIKCYSIFATIKASVIYSALNFIKSFI